MKYIYTDLVHGADPSMPPTDMMPYDPAFPVPPGGVVLEEHKPGEVWDSGLGAFRPRTPAELLAVAQAEKVQEFEGIAGRNMAALYAKEPDVAGFLATNELGNNILSARRSTMGDISAQLERAKAWVYSASTAEAVRVMVWDNVPAIMPLASVDSAAARKSRPKRKQPWYVRVIPGMDARLTALEAEVDELREALGRKVDIF